MPLDILAGLLAPIDGGLRLDGRQELTEEQPEEIPFRLAISLDDPEPLLLRGARVLDFEKGFGAETSLLVDNAKIQWIG